MNTTRLLEPVTWEIWFADGSRKESKHSTWSDFSDLIEIDGVSLHISREPIDCIVVHREDHSYGLSVEQAACCFGFHRWGAQFGLQEQSWLYSAFGFFREHERVILQVNKMGGRVLLQNRSTPLIL